MSSLPVITWARLSQHKAIQDESTVLRSNKTCQIKLRLFLCEHLEHISDKLGGKQAMALGKHASRLCSSYCWTTEDADSTSLPFKMIFHVTTKNMPCSAYHLFTAKLVKQCNQSATKITCKKDYLNILHEGKEDPRIVKGRKGDRGVRRKGREGGKGGRGEGEGKRYILLWICIFPMRINTGWRI